MSLTLFVTTATIKKRKQNIFNNCNYKEKEENIKKKTERQKNSTALTGNRTRAPRVAGEDSTTEPSVHS